MLQEMYLLLMNRFIQNIKDPSSLANLSLASLITLTAVAKSGHSLWKTKKLSSNLNVNHSTTNDGTTKKKTIDNKMQKPASIRNLEWSYLPVFWLLRISFWMNGPYFYAAYASKIINGTPASVFLISQITMVGYAALVVFGPIAGKMMKRYGPKMGTIASTLFLGLGAVSVTSNSLPVLILGRALNGIGTSLLSSAPEAWLVSESRHKERDPKGIWLKEIFGMAYAFDSIIAIAGGQLAGFVAKQQGPTTPFMVSPVFLAVAAFLTTMFWPENHHHHNNNNNKPIGKTKVKEKGCMIEALGLIRNDSKLFFFGCTEFLFKTSVYIFVIVWPPTVKLAIEDAFGGTAATPYGTIFSCFMASCMLGSTIFGMLPRNMNLTRSTVYLLATSSLALIIASAVSDDNQSMLLANNSKMTFLLILLLSYFMFETCVGIYFPSSAILRGKFLPDSHRTVLMALFDVPYNAMMVCVFSFLHKLDNCGALKVAAICLVVAFLCMAKVCIIEETEERELRNHMRNSLKKKVKNIIKVQKIVASFADKADGDAEDREYGIQHQSSITQSYGHFIVIH